MAVIIVFTTELEMGSFSNRNLLNWHIIHLFTFSVAKNFLFAELMLKKKIPWVLSSLLNSSVRDKLNPIFLKLSTLISYPPPPPKKKKERKKTQMIDVLKT